MISASQYMVAEKGSLLTKTELLTDQLLQRRSCILKVDIISTSMAKKISGIGEVKERNMLILTLAREGELCSKLVFFILILTITNTYLS